MEKTKNINQQLEDIFLVNAKDSLAHALDHFFEVSDSPTKKWHHQKWIILSVHHAASYLVGTLLKYASNDHPLFIGKNGVTIQRFKFYTARQVRKSGSFPSNNSSNA